MNLSQLYTKKPLSIRHLRFLFNTIFKQNKSLKTNSFTLYLLVFLSFCSLKISLAQAELNFSRIGVDDGLSQNTIFSIIQDHKGFMWFGTHDGLNKYDNYNFTNYKNIIGDNTTLADNIIYAICQSKFTNEIWIGTNDGGLCCFNYETEKFKTYKNNSNHQENSFIENTIKNIIEDDEGVLWLNYGTYGGVASFNPKTMEIKNYPFNPIYPREPNFGDISILLDSKGFLWATSDKGLYKLDRQTGIFESFQYTENNPNTIPSNFLTSIYEDKNYTFWIGTEEGLIKFDPQKNKFKLYQHNETDPFSISSNRINSILRDENGQLWISTRKGLNQFNDTTEEFWSLQHNPINNNSLSSNNLSNLYLDKGGILWIGTFENGLNKFDTHAKRFDQFTFNPKNPNGVPNKTVRSIYEDKYGILWVGFINGGLLRIDRKLNKFKTYDLKPSDFSASEPSTISAIFEDHTGTLWLGSWEYGLAKATFKGEGRNREIAEYTYYNHNEQDAFSISHQSIQFVYEDSKNRLWIGTAAGLDIYDRKNNHFKHFTHDAQNQNSLSDFSIQKAFVEDAQSVFWVGTWDGLNKISLSPDFDSKFEQIGSNINELAFFERFHNNLLDTNSLNDNRITSICLNNDQSLWVGQHGGGINKMEFLPNGTIEYTDLSEKNGLSNNVVYSIFNDKNGNIWCATNNGISQIISENNSILQYHKSDGLVSNEFFWGAGYKSKSGELFLGGQNGFNAFYPEHIQENKYEVPIVFTKLQVLYKQIEPDGVILSKNISEANNINLNWKDKVFSIEFSALHFNSPENIKYKYQLKGFDKDWINTGFHDRMITYTNLNPGDYEFCVKATNSDGIWNQNYQSINIYIKPPYWQSWWFRIIAFFVIAGFIYGLFLIRLKRINKQTKKLEKQVEDRTLHIQKQKEEISSQNEELIRLNSNKEKLVSILSHDLKGPIANMLSMVDILEDDWNSFTDQEKIDIFKRLKKNSQSNLELIDESLEFVRLSWNTIKPNISKRTISTIFKNLENTYLESLKRKNIHLSISGQTDEVVETDHDILRLILMNYISNAIKFTPKGKKIELKVKTIENKVHICVVDEGIGIPEDKLKTLFSEMDSFSRKGTEGEKSYGIGLQLVKEYAQIINAKTEVKSTVDVGSHFCVIFSVNWQ